MLDKISLLERFARFDDAWSPKVVADLNDAQVKLVKLRGDFVWHHHEHEDELFLVVKGALTMKLEGREVVVNAGELIVVPKGVEHCPCAAEDCWVVLVEPRTTLNTGNVQNERTVETLERL